MSQWFRYYDDALNDPKVQKLSGDLFKAWVNLLCLASKSGGEIKSASDAAFALRIPEPKARIIVAQLAGHGLLDTVTDGYFEPHNWSLRQFKSDGSNERVKRFREREKKRDCNVTETIDATGPEQSRTETDSEQKEIAAVAAPRPKRALKSFLAEGWKPEGNLSDRQTAELAKMHDWAKSNAIRKADWLATWRNWLRRAGVPEVPPESAPSGEPIHILEGTDEMDAWDRYYRQTTGMNAVRSPKYGGIFPPSRWPPGESDARDRHADQSSRP